MSDLVQSLLASGIPANHAQRVANAILQAASEQQRSSFTATRSTAAFASPANSKSFALFASGYAEYDKTNKTFGTGKAAFGVAGLAHINGQLAVNGDAYVGALDASGSITAKTVEARGLESESVRVLRAAEITDGKAVFTVPITSERRFVSQAGGQFSGDNLFDGPITITNKVNWDGPRKPANVQIPARIVSGGSGSLRVETKNVAVLNDHGNGVPFAITGALSGSSGGASFGGTVSLLGSTVTVITGATFNSETCQIVATTANIFNCTGATFAATSSGGDFLLASPWPTVSLNVG